MVFSRHIDNLKERPHHERRAVALLIATGVVVILFLMWALAFFNGIRASSQATAQAEAAAQQKQLAQDQADQAAAAASSGSINTLDTSSGQSTVVQ